MPELNKEKPEETKEKKCPFNQDLSCEDCRLFGGGNAGMKCVFHSIQWAVEGLDLFGGTK